VPEAYCWPGWPCSARDPEVLDVLHPEWKQQTTPASPRDALECVAALARTRECKGGYGDF